MVGGAIGGAAGGYAGGLVGGYLMTGDLRMAQKTGLNGLVSGLAMGGVSGGIGGYAAAKEAGINPWTGKAKNSVTIGEGMITDPSKGWMGVDKIAEDLGSGKYDPDPSIPKNVNLLKNNVGTTSELMYDNAVWIEMQMEQNVIIYDRGHVGNNSQYYNMELGRTMNYSNIYNVKAIYSRTQTIRLLILYK
ncbi:MAG: hypothetical protein PHO12_08030 [Bacteroidales bacterium]|nr:hypothetical protein [Bacteroidales bacterium]MDD4684743.1 hypothetical protein [Bacteroidales bacterium]